MRPNPIRSIYCRCLLLQVARVLGWVGLGKMLIIILILFIYLFCNVILIRLSEVRGFFNFYFGAGFCIIYGYTIGD